MKMEDDSTVELDNHIGLKDWAAQMGVGREETGDN